MAWSGGQDGRLPVLLDAVGMPSQKFLIPCVSQGTNVMTQPCDACDGHGVLRDVMAKAAVGLLVHKQHDLAAKTRNDEMWQARPDER
jgi:hypothetical protein